MRKIAAASELDLWWNWAFAELDSRRFEEAFRPYVSEELQTKVRTDRADKLTEKDWDGLKYAVFNFRRPLLQDLLPLGIVWSTQEMDLSELPNVRIMNYEPHTRLAPSRTLSEFAAALDDGRNPQSENEFGVNYRTTRDAFRLETMRGRPILVAEATSGPCTLLEGYTRLTVIASLWKAGRIDSKPISILLGVCPRLKKWRFY